MGNLEERALLSGKTAVVIGGAEGLGDVSLALAEAGVDIALCDVNAEALERRAKEIDDLGRLRLSTVVNVCEPTAIAQFYEALDQVLDHVDIVVNVPGGGVSRPFLDSNEADWDVDAQWNFLYVARSCWQAISRMKPAGGGTIVNITTIEAHRGIPGMSMYGAYKSATTSLTRSLAVEYGQYGIRLNCVAPDCAPTPGLRKGRALNPRRSYDDPSKTEALEAERDRMYMPLGRAGVPDDIANCVLFLASDLARYVTGQTIHCDGGTWASSGWVKYPFSGYLVRPGEVETERMLRD